VPPIFPDDWPLGCPPPDAVDPNGDFFACHKENPPSADDFKTAAEKGLHADRDPCQRRGLSVCRTADDAREVMRRFPRAFRYVSKGVVGAEHGKVKKTAGPVPSHHTFWKCQTLTFQQLLTQVV